MRRQDIRNVAIIAHVDHGKTTLVDAMMRQCKLFRNIDQMGDCILDSGDLERERGITIVAKNMSLTWQGVKINIVDTPGHSDFGGEVERVLRMVDGALLLIDAAEGPLPQTRFVLKKALELGLRPIVVINKTDRPDARIHEVLNETVDLFIELDADDEQWNFPVIYASGRNGTSTTNLADPARDLTPLFQSILDHVPAPEYDPESPLSGLITNITHDDYIGRIGIGRLLGGRVRTGDPIVVLSGGDKQVLGQVQRLFVFEGLERTVVSVVEAGELFAFAGVPSVTIGDSIADPERPIRLNILTIEPPTVSMMFMVNNSPFGGREGKHVTSSKLRERVEKELRTNVSISVEWGDSPDRFTVAGRGELQLAILIEQMRREGYEFQVSMPQVITKTDGDKVLEPYETLVADMPKECSGPVIRMLGGKKGVLERIIDLKGTYTRLTFTIPMRGLFGFRMEFLSQTRGNGVMAHTYLGYREWAGKIGGRRNGVLVSDHTGTVATYAVANIQDRGRLFVSAGDTVYTGQIVGETMYAHDLKVNPTKQKHLTNMRSSTSDIAAKIDAPALLALDQMMDYINDDELLEVTPTSLRMRKKLLDFKERKRAGLGHLSLVPFALVICLVSLAALWPAQRSFAQEKTQAQAAYEYTVRAITIAVTVQDSKGRFVNNLVEKDFTVFENNKKKPLTYFMHDFGAPLSLTVLLDVSGSMALENKLAECKAALRNLVTRLLRPRDEVALLLFADGQVEVAAKHATDKTEFLRVLEKTEAYGQTALNDAVAVSPEFATRAKNEKRALLLLTDGLENDSQASPEQALEIARRVDVPIYTIGYKIPRSEQILKSHKRSASLTTTGIVATLDRFSQATGGKAYFLNEPADLASVVQEIKNEQTHQYIIGYTSYQDTADIFRSIRVTTPNYKNKVRTRQGY